MRSVVSNLLRTPLNSPNTFSFYTPLVPNDWSRSPKRTTLLNSRLPEDDHPPASSHCEARTNKIHHKSLESLLPARTVSTWGDPSIAIYSPALSFPFQSISALCLVAGSNSLKIRDGNLGGKCPIICQNKFVWLCPPPMGREFSPGQSMHNIIMQLMKPDESLCHCFCQSLPTPLDSGWLLFCSPAGPVLATAINWKWCPSTTGHASPKNQRLCSLNLPGISVQLLDFCSASFVRHLCPFRTVSSGIDSLDGGT